MHIWAVQNSGAERLVYESKFRIKVYFMYRASIIFV